MHSIAGNEGRRLLDLELPAPPAVLARMMALLAEPVVDLDALSDLIEADMSLSSALLRAVNSSLFNLAGRIQTVREAMTFLGCRDVAGIALHHALRAAFPPMAELEQVWERAARRGQVMALLAHSLGFNAWAAHSAGLFEECGMALLFRHSPEPYRQLWREAGPDSRLLASLELDLFGASHDIVGAALCETWGLQPSAVHCVRHHIAAQTTLELVGAISHRQLGATSVLAQRVMNDADDFEQVVEMLAPQIDVPVDRLKSLIPATGEGAWSARATGRP